MQAIIFAREEKGNKERVQLRKKEMVGADGSNGKDGIFCGKEKMQMSVYYSIGSILLGLAAWWIPYAVQVRLKSGGWTTLVIRPFRTFTAKQGLSPLLFMLKSNKNLEPV